MVGPHDGVKQTRVVDERPPIARAVAAFDFERFADADERLNCHCPTILSTESPHVLDEHDFGAASGAFCPFIYQTAESGRQIGGFCGRMNEKAAATAGVYMCQDGRW